MNALAPEAVRKLLGTRSTLGIQSVNTLENHCGVEASGRPRA